MYNIRKTYNGILSEIFRDITAARALECSERSCPLGGIWSPCPDICRDSAIRELPNLYSCSGDLYSINTTAG
jgi:hypothetical protein